MESNRFIPPRKLVHRVGGVVCPCIPSLLQQYQKFLALKHDSCLDAMYTYFGQILVSGLLSYLALSIICLVWRNKPVLEHKLHKDISKSWTEDFIVELHPPPL